MSTIQLRGVRTHNLKNIDLDLPRNQLVVITGLSGSGKSSLAFDTLYAEGQRRYVESLSAYARQFLSMMEKPEVDVIEGLSPAIAIEQKSASHNPRSTVGTITEIYDYLRLLYARIGQPCCPLHHHALQAQTISQMVDSVLALPEGTAVMLLAPVVRERKGEHLQLLEQLKSQGFIRARIDGKLVELDEAPKLSLRKKHTIEVVVDRVKVRPDVQQRLAESFETAVRLADGLASVAPFEGNKIEERTFSERYACPDCGYSLEELEPRLFSFNNPMGACPSCDGLGVQQYFDPEKIIHNEKASLANGAIRGWDRRNLYYYQLLSSLAKHFGFDMEIPYSRLPKSIRQMLLYGSEKEAVTFYLVSHNGKKTKRTYPFEGIIPIMERRYRETESQAVREELAKYLTMSECETCQGSRLRKEARHVFLESKNLPEITAMSIGNALQFFQSLKLEGKRGKIAEKILKEVNARLGFLVNVGLNYLNLARSAETLSGGEAQRIRLASQIGSGLVGVMYILDEPSIGLHQRDNERLLKTLKRLRDLGNTVIVVEHDEDAIRTADYVVDIGPGAGVHGGEIVAEGSPSEIMKNPRSLTGQYLSGKKTIPVPKKRRLNSRYSLSLKGARCNNLKNVDVEIPIGLMTCITGVSGSGKSSLISDTLYPIVASRLNGATQRRIGPYQSISGLEYLDKVVEIDQSPIGRTPRSNPATYTGIFTPVRELFAGTPESRARGYLPGRFSFNVKGGRCEACEGDGVIKVEMHFLADIYVVCDVCKGKRYNRETLEIQYKGKNVYDVLQMTVEDAREFFDAIPVIARKLQTLIDVGLSYITLGQSATTLSGGEAQRIKLSRELSKRETGRTLYLLDEPTTGLHFHDILQLLTVLHRLRDGGNTIVIIEHNLDVIKVADWIIDMGPEGGDAGGHVVVTGTPETVAKCKESHTGRFLKPVLKTSFSPKPLPEKVTK
ncbi:excinuclease ABC subunit UvrA [Coxiella burnetii]|uniref:UvrABC system protein A n=2 Tax=Coxiella burnetii TaxID=777 RepID=Q83EP1_COXBU|nr:excinuclease ABC subunit UvrA [Coxiella burnetii]NP_819318.1 excinuclease ABC subunit A [Coxiella burnetii RSA 493]AAO89832.1 excinuclease ABC subunit A [Coxiella burnetii RSA 493]ARI65172.1 excinuclease ABC subunit A [Coxiella burnetii]ARK26661.1 excinuclease ABC subunit A [Coxiella burnetii]MCF2094143.1 excinuclease ABC subunit UvrA [Coxiella burnetii]MCF2096144.1 excinuclease ABC subunit UvrA [Coxiella burnetii]